MKQPKIQPAFKGIVNKERGDKLGILAKKRGLGSLCLSFEEGKYYPFTITINYFTGIEISANIEPWENGFAPGTENDSIGEDAPSIL